MSVARAATAAASSIAAHAAVSAAARATAPVLPPKLASGVAPKFAVHMSQRCVTRHNGACDGDRDRGRGARGCHGIGRDAAKTVSVASNTAVRCSLATPSCSTRA